MASLPPRPKPWETSTPVASTSTAKPTAFDVATQNQSVAPILPDRPSGLDGMTTGYGGTSAVQQPYQSRYNSNYGMSSYGGMGAMGGLGGMGGMGYGGYSSQYNRMGGGYGGYGMSGYGVGGLGGPGEGFPTLSSSLQSSTAPAFAVLESLVTAFTSLAQLVESTYMATHSSFFAMVGVADQLGSLKTYLGQVLGVFSILRIGRRIINYLRGNSGPNAARSATEGWVNEWAGGVSRPGGNGNGNGTPRPSSKPLLLFLLSAVGLPYLMNRLVKLLIANQQQQQQEVTIDPSKLIFARTKFEFKATEEWELNLGRDEIVAVLEKRSKDGEEGWWRGRTRDGRLGWFPSNYVEVIRRREEGENKAG
ncbi:peroxin-13, partial [Tremellales sp. Uapishka_1]